MGDEGHDQGVDESPVESDGWPRVIGQVSTGPQVRYVIEPDAQHIVVVSTDGEMSGWASDRSQWMRASGEHLESVADPGAAATALTAADLDGLPVRHGPLGIRVDDFDGVMDEYGGLADGWDDLHVGAPAPGVEVVEKARQFVHDRTLPPPDVVSVSLHGSLQQYWEGPDGEEMLMSFCRDGTVVVLGDFVTDGPPGELPVQKEVDAAVGLIRRWAGIEPDPDIPGIDTALMVVSLDRDSWPEDYVLDLANRTVERTYGECEPDLSPDFRSRLDSGTGRNGDDGSPPGWSWDAGPHAIAGAIERAGHAVYQWYVWGCADAEAPSVGTPAEADTFVALVARADRLDPDGPEGPVERDVLLDAAAFPSRHGLPLPAVAGQQGADRVDLVWPCEHGVLTVRVRSNQKPVALLTTPWGHAEAMDHGSSDDLVRQVSRAVRNDFVGR